MWTAALLMDCPEAGILAVYGIYLYVKMYGLCNFSRYYRLILLYKSQKMKTATVTEFRSRMKERLKEIEDDQDILILSGSKKRDFVVLTLEAFNAMEETAHLLSTSANTSRLMESIAQDKAGGATVRQLNLYDNKPVRKRMASKKQVSTKRKR